MRIYYTHLCGKYQGRSWCGSSTSQLLVRATPKPMHQHVFMTCISALLRLHTWQTDVHAIYVSTIAFFAKLHSISELGWHPHKHGVANTHTHTHKRDYHRTGPTSRVYLLHKQISHVYTRSCPITREQHVWFARFEFFESTRPAARVCSARTNDARSRLPPHATLGNLARMYTQYVCMFIQSITSPAQCFRTLASTLHARHQSRTHAHTSCTPTERTSCLHISPANTHRGCV
jgi:hypothetical protein